jgi:predicted HicB family RNase H-like nuclease
MKNMMTYKNYYGSVNFNDEDNVFYGRIEFIKALVSYEGTDVTSLRKAFLEAVEDYLQVCEESGEKPEKSFKGVFNVRIDQQLHRELAIEADRAGVSLNALIAQKLSKTIVA